MDIELNPQTGVQKYIGLKDLPTPDLVYICVALAPLDSASRDRFFILTMSNLQIACERHYKNWMDPHDWRRPRKVDSYNLRYRIEDLAEFEDNWTLIVRRLQEQRDV